MAGTFVAIGFVPGKAAEFASAFGLGYDLDRGP